MVSSAFTGGPSTWGTARGVRSDINTSIANSRRTLDNIQKGGYKLPSGETAAPYSQEKQAHEAARMQYGPGSTPHSALKRESRQVAYQSTDKKAEIDRLERTARSLPVDSIEREEIQREISVKAEELIQLKERGRIATLKADEGPDEWVKADKRFRAIEADRINAKIAMEDSLARSTQQHKEVADEIGRLARLHKQQPQHN